ncbi:MAG: META domain-containing protein [Rubripirellula sp.]
MWQRWLIVSSMVMLFACRPSQAATDVDPLPSWNESPRKSAIVRFVEETTRADSPGFVEPESRIAVFDNDGTLWPENPLPFQLLFAIDELKRLVPEHPEWRQNNVLAATLDGNLEPIKADLKNSLMQVLQATHAGMTTEEFNDRVYEWITTAKHPRFKRPYIQLGYQPMLELLQYLRDHGYRTYIVSGGGVDFMRAWAEEAYGIPPEQVIGSMGEVKFEMRSGEPVLLKQGSVAFIDDKAGKPVGIHRRIGRRSVAAFGNSDGDKEMLEWTTVGRSPSFGLIVHHTDAKREYAYDADPKSSGKLVVALADAPKRGWFVVDMAKDWNQVFLTGDSRDALYQQAWLVEDIEGKGVVDRAQSTVAFSPDGMVSGSTAVNRFHGKATIEGDEVTFGALATTRRAGPPALMDQESRYLRAMEKVARFKIEPTGILFLLDGQGEAVLRLSPMETRESN